jgi:hypothetical protein
MFNKVAQQGHSEREAERYTYLYVEALSDARTKLEVFFNILPPHWFVILPSSM